MLRVWALLGDRVGDNNQVLALARSVGTHIEEKRLRYTLLRRLPRPLRGAKLLSLRSSSRNLIRPPWPDLVIGVGYRSVPVARYIKRKSGGRTRIVQLGNPRASAKHFDLLLSSPQYQNVQGPNVIQLSLPVTPPMGLVGPDSREKAWLCARPRPLRLVLIGGATKGWQINHGALKECVLALVEKCCVAGGSIVAVRSPRTDPATEALVEGLMQAAGSVLIREFPRYAVLRENADELYVTADSVSMLSEAIASGKPVGIIPVMRTPKPVWRAIGEKVRLLNKPQADLTAFWNSVLSKRLAGLVDHPTAAKVQNTLEVARESVLKLFS